MKRLFRAVVLALGLVVSSEAWAETLPMSVQDVVGACESNERGLMMYCYGIIIGVTGVLQLNGADKTGRFRLCLDTFPSLERRLSTFLSWAKTTPDAGGIPASWGMVQAYNEAWPCPK